MAIEEVVETLVTHIIKAVKFALLYVLWCFLLFNIGRFSLLMVTLGRYPRIDVLERDSDKIAFAGFVVLFLIWCCIAFYNQVLNK